MSGLFGWISPEERTPQQQRLWEDYMSKTPYFSLRGESYDVPDKVILTDVWKHPTVNKALGFDFPGVHQLTGSCVGAGGGNVLMTTLCMDIIERGDNEKLTIPFWPYSYGRSRYYAGIGGEGEGSFGAAFAEAVRKDGTIDNFDEKLNLPKPTNGDALTWGASVEMKWSNGAAIKEEFLNVGRKFLVKTTAPCKTAVDVMLAIQNGYAVTCASMWGGNMQCEVVDGILLNRKTTQWAHQMSVQAVWKNHRTHGTIYYIMNQWGLNTHGTCPSGAAPGGFWVKESDMEWICKTGEVFAFSQFDGFPTRKLSWIV